MSALENPFEAETELAKARAEIERLRAALLRIASEEYGIAPAEIACRALEGDTALRTCATCHAVLAPGPQPAATYEQKAPCPVCDERIGHKWNCSLNQRY